MIKTTKIFKNTNPILVGLFAVLFVLFGGVAVGIAGGFVTPSEVFAQVLPPTQAPPPAPTPILPSTPAPVPVPAPILPPTPATAVAPAPVLPSAPAPTASAVAPIISASTQAPIPVVVTVPIYSLTVTPSPVPECTISLSKTQLQEGGEDDTLSWSTTAATSATIDNGIGDVSIDSGSKTVHISKTTKYTLKVSGSAGEASCSVGVVVKVKKPVQKGCIEISKKAFDSDGKKIISVPQFTFVLDGKEEVINDKNGNAIFNKISPGKHVVTEKLSGNVWKLLSVVPDNGKVSVKSGSSCATVVFKNKKIKEPPVPVAPTCILSANPNNVSSGGHSVLSWTTKNANEFSINNGIGDITSIVKGSTITPAISSDTTYIGTVTNRQGKIVTCKTTVTVSGGGGGIAPYCKLSVSPSSISFGGSATLSWSGGYLLSGSIDNGIGALTKMSSSTQVSPGVGSHKYTGTFKATNGETVTCSVTLIVSGGGGGCTSNCGGGGSIQPTITLTMLKKPNVQPLAFVYLSQIPYTGLDLGPVGTVVYWLTLILWSLAGAYFILFIGLPYANRQLRYVGTHVHELLNTKQDVGAEYSDSDKPFVMADASGSADVSDIAPEVKQSYSTYDGFRSFAKEGGALTIDDIVKGLSRNEFSSVSDEDTHEKVKKDFLKEGIMIENDMSKKKEIDIANVAEEVVETVQQEEKTKDTVVGIATDTRGFLIALLEGDRNAVFSTLRQVVRGGGSIERFLADVTCALDDIYRARVDGTSCDQEISRVSAKYATPVLENIISALTTAIDSSYTSGITGAKLALTRVLSQIGV